MENYIVRFTRIDSKPEEEYYYNYLIDAEYHYKLFESDDSGLYSQIDLLKWERDITILKTNRIA